MKETGLDKGGDGYGVSGSGMERDRIGAERSSRTHGNKLSGIMEMLSQRPGYVGYSQESIPVTLVEMPNSGDMKLEKATSISLSGPPGEG